MSGSDDWDEVKSVAQREIAAIDAVEWIIAELGKLQNEALDHLHLDQPNPARPMAAQWKMSANRLCDQVMAMTPYPGDPAIRDWKDRST